MLLIAGTVRFPLHAMAEARVAMATMIAATRAESGCVSYGFAEDVLDPGLIHITERWEDQAAIDAHGATPHMADWRAAGRALGIGERDLFRYEIAGAHAI